MPNCKSFLVTEAERKHVRQRGRFQQHRDASCHQIFFPARQGTKGNSHYSDSNIRGTCTIVCHCQKLAQFKRGDFSTCDVPCSGQPKTVTTPENTDQIHELILEDRRISAKSIAEQLGISCERVHENLDTRKLSAKWVPKCRNADQKRQRCQSSEQILEFFRRDANDFMSRFFDHGRNLVISL